jgi:hypothetical protein
MGVQDLLQSLQGFLNKWVSKISCAPLKKLSALNHAITATAFLQMGIDFNGNLYALEQYHQSNQLLRENATAIRNLLARYGRQEFTCMHFGSDSAQNDVEAFSTQKAYNGAGVRTVRPRQTAADVGIDLIKEHLRIDPGRRNSFTQEKGAPKLFISKQRCPNLWREMKGLKAMDDNGRFKYLGADYSVSCLRVILMTRPKAPIEEKRQVEPVRQYGARS